MLPALPARWPKGRLTGLRLRGGASLDLAWSEGRLVEARFGPRIASSRELVYRGARRTLSLAPGTVYRFAPGG